jgi:hypothetical protein
MSHDYDDKMNMLDTAFVQEIEEDDTVLVAVLVVIIAAVVVK